MTRTSGLRIRRSSPRCGPATGPRSATALDSARLLVAVVALPGAEHASEGEMALALLESADGRQALPAFTGLDTLAAWSAQARPVPRPAGGDRVRRRAVARRRRPRSGAPHACTLLTERSRPTARTAFGSPTWKPSRRPAAPPPRTRSTPWRRAREPLIAVICPDGTLDADWAQQLLGHCPEGTGVLALPRPDARRPARRRAARLTLDV